jgi:polycomb protein EED
MPVKLADIWFLRMSVNQELGLAVCGNRAGNVCVWRVGAHPPSLVGANALGHKTLTAAVRQTDVSRDGRTVLAGCDGGEVWRWDFATPNEEKKERERERAAGGRGGAAGPGGGDGGAEDGREGAPEVIELE